MPLSPDVLLSDGAVAPFRDGHHAGAIRELTDDAGPLSGSELDRVRRDLGRCAATGPFDVRLHGRDVLLDAMGRGLSLPVDQYVGGVMVREDAGPVSAVPSHEIQLIHGMQVAINRVVVRQLRSTSAAIESSATQAHGIADPWEHPRPDGRDWGSDFVDVENALETPEVLSVPREERKIFGTRGGGDQEVDGSRSRAVRPEAVTAEKIRP
jgi:hypothetical protein